MAFYRYLVQGWRCITANKLYMCTRCGTDVYARDNNWSTFYKLKTRRYQLVRVYVMYSDSSWFGHVISMNYI